MVIPMQGVATAKARNKESVSVQYYPDRNLESASVHVRIDAIKA